MQTETNSTVFSIRYARFPVHTAAVQARHTRIVTEFMCSARGDLILNGHGDLCERQRWSDDYRVELAWRDHTCGNVIALMTRFGWTLTSHGAEFILDSECFEKRDAKFLKAIRGDRSWDV